ncbi:serine/threonine-protein kinase [Niabella ginsengisoli]|uniref:non-specific serine/threonine protein kinase n=1 Tax=Niabella ginsengisoli TaxID=522298 RepID=A0ABS9SJ54_9BACT|nr:serine/threonine-protein kinase [Niabella ginsengisoli]MCH5598341.1 serine/threonine protein kinase [Niabella ginsengisoli]
MENTSINGYVLKYKLGDGGMAEVWYAENYLQKPAAIKVLLKKFCDDPEIVSRFQNEARLMVHLNHHAIRNIQDYGALDDRPCMIMEYLEGQDLHKRMKNGETFSNEQLAEWWNDLVDALQYTHRKDIIHRDIKPANLFVTETGKIKLLDFGVAKLKDNITVTQTGSRMGTLMYMSPEQVYDVKNLTNKTDAYSLAVTFYHLVTGKPPYDSSKISDFEIQESIVRKNIDVTSLVQPWRDLLPGYFNKNAEQRSELHKINDTSADIIGDTIYVNPVAPVEKYSPVANEANPETKYQYPPKRQGRSAFYILFPVAIILGLIAFALNKDKIAGYLKNNERQTTAPKKRETTTRPKEDKPVFKAEIDTSIPPLPDTITTDGENGSLDQVVVSVDIKQREEEAKQFINNYYRSRGSCTNLSAFFNDVVTQYYNKSNVPLANIRKECESYHGKWQFTEADISNDSYVFTHNQNGKLYIDFTMLYKIKQNETDDWIPYNIDVAMVIDENNKIERIVERRIEKL